MFPYVSRLIWMSLASFFLAHLAAGLAMWWVTPAAIRVAQGMRARSASGLLLATRLFPSAFAIFVAAALCVPSYLWLEPEAAGEEISIPCLAAAIVCGSIWAMSITRSIRALAKSRRYLKHCRAVGREIPLPGRPGSAWVVEGIGNGVGLAGIFRPQIVIRKEVFNALSGEELETALRHEWAHWASRDNLKRLAMLATPDLIPFVRGGFPALEKAWVSCAEWAADDRAVGGDPQRSLTLAAALVRVAQVGVGLQAMPLVTSLGSETRELSVRVERLLRQEKARLEVPQYIVIGAFIVILAAAVVAIRPESLYTMHQLLEKLAR